MTLCLESRSRYIRRLASCAICTVLLFSPLSSVSNAIVLTKDGPKTAYEGDLIEYTLAIENSGMTIIEGTEVLDALPSEVDFVDSVSTPGGVYNPLSGIWTLPTLGTGEGEKTAELKIQALMRANLIEDPAKFVTAINMAEVITPVLPEPILAKVTTHIVCAFCIDWEILSVELGYEDKIDDDKYKAMYLFYVRVANNGPVMSEATVSATHFNISGGGYGTVTLMPSVPVAVSLDAGETQILTYTTGWVDGADSDYKMTWVFEVSDVSLLDPILPNTAAGSFEGDVEGGSGGGGGCTINKDAATDPVWVFLLIITSLWYRRCRIRSIRYSYLE